MPTGSSSATSTSATRRVASRGSTTKLLLRTKDASMPVGTVAIQVVIRAKRFSGSYNDGYIDNVGLYLSH